MGKDDNALSIAETNEMRKKLGLKPLNVVTSEEKAARAAAEIKQREDLIKAAKQEAENDEVRERIARSRKKRMLNKKIKGKSLGASLAKATGGSAADWVRRSREIERRKQAAKFDELDAEEEAAYTEKDLKGLKVQHNLEDFQEGRQVILTLADRPLIKGHFDDQELNDEEDELQNAEMALNEKYEKLNEAKKKMLKPKYDVYGDNPEQGLLPQYDEEEDLKKKKDGMRLGGDEPDSEEERLQRAARVRERLKKKKNDLSEGKTVYSLGEQPKIRSDYKKPEVVKFKKRKKKSKDGKKKKRRTRTTSTLDFLPEPTDEQRQRHHGSRQAGNKKLERETSEKRKRKKKEADASYLRALNKADTKAFIMPADDEAEDFDYEDKFDVQLQTALARAREVSTKERTRSKDKKDKTAELAKEVLSVVKEEPEEKESNPADGIILSATSEFCRGLEDVAVKEKKKINTYENDMQVEVAPEADSDDDAEDEKEEGEMDVENGTDKDDDGDNDDDDDDNVDFLHDEPLASSGMAAVLSLAKRRGLLDDTEKKKKLNDPAPNLNLEYPDEYGRPMSQKEAFRKLSHAFHGRTPGKMKQEKKMKKYIEELKSKRVGNVDDPTHSIAKLKERQKASGKAFLLLDQKLTAEDREKLVKEAQRLAKRKKKKERRKAKAAKAAAKKAKAATSSSRL